MLLDQEKIAKAAEWLRNHGVISCSMCNDTDDFLINEIVSPHMVNPDRNASDPYLGVPLLTVICKRCRHVMLFDAVGIGLMPHHHAT